MIDFSITYKCKSVNKTFCTYLIRKVRCLFQNANHCLVLSSTVLTKQFWALLYIKIPNYCCF